MVDGADSIAKLRRLLLVVFAQEGSEVAVKSRFLWYSLTADLPVLNRVVKHPSGNPSCVTLLRSCC